jgi:hypothetical protein
MLILILIYSNEVVIEGIFLFFTDKMNIVLNLIIYNIKLNDNKNKNIYYKISLLIIL